mmetsp:Transcript_5654/g.19044  ORF Transcript_5654/g.19044 Transcript_5654/m.19044 type:complete len:225 (-) Transcript_5654:2064-2738(-)
MTPPTSSYKITFSPHNPSSTTSSIKFSFSSTFAYPLLENTLSGKIASDAACFVNVLKSLTSSGIKYWQFLDGYACFLHQSICGRTSTKIQFSFCISSFARFGIICSTCAFFNTFCINFQTVGSVVFAKIGAPAGRKNGDVFTFSKNSSSSVYETSSLLFSSLTSSFTSLSFGDDFPLKFVHFLILFIRLLTPKPETFRGKIEPKRSIDECSAALTCLCSIHLSV